MKLIPKSDTNGRCRAITNNGLQCARKASEQGYCKQHYKLMKAQDKVETPTGNAVYDHIPEPPLQLGEHALRSWKVYCQFLIDEGRLFDPYLFGLAELCYLEEKLIEVEKKIEEHGAVNVYNNGFQRNGYAMQYDSLIKSIRGLRSDYGLNYRTDKNISSDSRKNSKLSYITRRQKDW